MNPLDAPTPQAPWLVADIGGTNARFALVEGPDPHPLHLRRLDCADHPDLAHAARTYLEQTGAPAPAAACVALAAPVDGDRIRLTNAHWDLSLEATRTRLGLDHLEALNDFAALALALPHLGPADLVALGGPPAPAPATEKPMAVLGPGTGLGVAALIPTGSGWTALAGEGGHADMCAVEERELAVVGLLRREQAAVSAESLLCGSGLTRLHSALARIRGEQAPPRSAAAICAAAPRDALCAETLEVFCNLLGGFAGDTALTLGATGGVFLGGGILPRIIPHVRSSGFRRRFEAKHRMGAYLENTATMLITAQAPALLGAAARLHARTRPHQGAARAPLHQ